MPLWVFAAALAATWFLNLKLLLTHDPLSRALQLGADLAKEQALKAIPQDWMGWLAQPVITTRGDYVVTRSRPYLARRMRCHRKHLVG